MAIALAGPRLRDQLRNAGRVSLGYVNDDSFNVLRCEDCGDTFPAAGDVVPPRCPSCGSGRVVPATEPLL